MLDLSLQQASTGASYLVLAVVGPDVIQMRGREKRRGMSEEFTAVAYGEKHLRTTNEKPASSHRYVLTCEQIKSGKYLQTAHLHFSRHAPFEHPWF